MRHASRFGVGAAVLGAVGMFVLASGWPPLIGAFGALVSMLCYGLSENWRGVGRRVQAESGLVDWPTFQFILRFGALIGLAWVVLLAVVAR